MARVGRCMQGMLQSQKASGIVPTAATVIERLRGRSRSIQLKASMWSLTASLLRRRLGPANYLMIRLRINDRQRELFGMKSDLDIFKSWDIPRHQIMTVITTLRNGINRPPRPQSTPFRLSTVSRYLFDLSDPSRHQSSLPHPATDSACPALGHTTQCPPHPKAFFPDLSLGMNRSRSPSSVRSLYLGAIPILCRCCSISNKIEGSPCCCARSNRDA